MPNGWVPEMQRSSWAVGGLTGSLLLLRIANEYSGAPTLQQQGDGIEREKWVDAAWVLTCPRKIFFDTATSTKKCHYNAVTVVDSSKQCRRASRSVGCCLVCLRLQTLVEITPISPFDTMARICNLQATAWSGRTGRALPLPLWTRPSCRPLSWLSTRTRSSR